MENAATAAHAARSLLLTVARHCRSRCPRRRGALASTDRRAATSTDRATLAIDEELHAGIEPQPVAPRVRRLPPAQLPPRDDERIEDQVERQRGDQPVQEQVEPGRRG